MMSIWQMQASPNRFRTSGPGRGAIGQLDCRRPGRRDSGRRSKRHRSRAVQPRHPQGQCITLRDGVEVRQVYPHCPRLKGRHNSCPFRIGPCRGPRRTGMTISISILQVANVLDMDAISASMINLGVDPLGAVPGFITGPSRCKWSRRLGTERPTIPRIKVFIISRVCFNGLSLYALCSAHVSFDIHLSHPFR